MIYFSKSSVYRHLQALKRRNRYPESYLWESSEGRAWLTRLVVAVLLEFGIKRGVGADHLSLFFQRVHLDQHIGLSPSSLLQILERIENLAVSYALKLEEERRQTGQEVGIVAAGDETFFNDVVILVLSDLQSGFLLVEEATDNRTYETWQAAAKKRLEELRLHVDHFVSDRARALLKLAASGFGCSFGADLFHGEREIVKGFGLAFHRRLIQIKAKLERASGRMKEQYRSADAEVKAEATRAEVKECEAELERVQVGQNNYRHVLQKISESVHPFTLEGDHQTSGQVEEVLREQVTKLYTIAEESGITWNRSHLDKFERQIGDLSRGIDVWQLLVKSSIESQKVPTELSLWLWYVLLPVVYWHRQMTRTGNATMKLMYQSAWQQAHDVWKDHAITKGMVIEEAKRWQAWAEDMAGKFQRASSAVEGRNGWLSQMYGNGRGITSRRLRMLTIIHNYDIRRSDGTTAAERLFGVKHPDLFEWLVGQIGELPMARKRQKKASCNSLIF